MSEVEIKDEELNVLFHACKLGRTDIVQHAIATMKKKENLSQEELLEIISTPNSDGATALHVAAFNGHSDVVRALLNIGARPTVALEYGDFSYKSPYEVANHSAIQAFHVYLFEQIAMGHSSIIDDLVSSGIPADLADDSTTADTTLHWAISFNNIDAAEMLLNLGVPVDVTNNQGKSCLHLACQSSNVQFLKLLLNWGADVSLEDECGKIAEEYIKDDKVELREVFNTPVEEVRTSPIKLKKSPSNLTDDRSGEQLEDREPSNEDETDDVHDDVMPKEENNNDSTDSYVVLETPPPVKQSSDLSHSPTEHNSPSYENSNELFRDIISDNSENQENGQDNDMNTEKSRQSYETPSSASSDSSLGEEAAQLILWPPAQRQLQNPKKQPYVITLNRPLIISCDEDFSHILNSSRLISTLHGVGVQTDVLTSGQHADAHLRLYIDHNVCPTRQSFDIHIEYHSIRLIAADETGLLYAINTLIQLLKLHSDYITNPPAAGAENSSLVVNFIKIPAMTIHDWPNVSNRGVLWSYPRDTRTKYEHMKDFLVFMSEIRLNQLYLRVDCDKRENDVSVSPLTSQDEEEGGEEYREGSGTAGIDDYSLEVIALANLSQQYCIECVPTIVFTSTQQIIPDVVLRRLFHCTTVSVSFVMHTDTEERSRTYKLDTFSFIRNIFQNLLLAGYKSILLSYADWMVSGDGEMDKCPATIAVEVGLHAVTYPLDHFFAELPFSRSLMSTKDYAKPLLQRTKDILNKKKQNALALLPAMAASDFYYPTILLKHMSFLHAGSSWNHRSLEDILGSYLDDHSMLRPALSTLLFQTYNPSDAETYNSEEVFQNAMLDIFTNNDTSSDISRSLSQQLSVSFSSQSQLQLQENSQYSPGSPPVPRDTMQRSTAEIEGAIWSLVAATESFPSMTMPVSKEEAIHTLKRTKRILSSVNWKVADSKQKSLCISSEEESSTGNSMNISMIETEEYMRMLNLVNIVCRTIVMACNSAQKPVVPLQTINPTAAPVTKDVSSFEESMDSLSPGISSDLANAILESMTLCGSVWTERLHAKYFTNTDHEQKQQTVSPDDNRSHPEQPGILVERYIHVQRAELPLLAIFSAICKHMPAFSPDVLMKIFEDGVVAEVSVEPAVSTARGWSLWG